MIARICAERHYADGIIDSLCQVGFDECEKLVSDRHAALQYIEWVIDTEHCKAFYDAYNRLDSKKRGKITFMPVYTSPPPCT